MLDAARPHLLRIFGPNCIGALVPGVGLNASFAPGNAQPGRLAFVTQSGALATAMLDWANSRGIGFSHFISVGDSADVDFGDVLDYPRQRPWRARHPDVHGIGEGGAQIHVGGPRGRAQQAGDRGESRPRAGWRSRGGVAHRRAGRVRCGV